MSGDERPGIQPEAGHDDGAPSAPGAQPPPEPAAAPAPAYLRLVRGGPADGGSPGDGLGRPDSGRPGPGPGHHDAGHDDLDAAEREVRALLHRAVGGLDAAPGSLQRIQHAVPQRRARRRQAWTGAAAVLLLAAAAVPALRTAVDAAGTDHIAASQAAGSSGDGGPGPSLQGGDGATALPGTGLPGATASTAGTAAPDPGVGTTASGAAAAGATASAGSGTGPTGIEQSGARSPGSASACRAGQLTAGAARVDPADSAGRVYGSFTVLNSSAEPCTVEGAGTVQVSSAVGTDASRFPVLAHTAGDPAPGLPQPSTGSDTLLLQPGAAYVVRFGWVPDGANATACAPTPSPTPSGGTAIPDATGAPGTTGSGSQTAAPGSGTATPGTARSSVSLSHTPAAGAPSVGPATIPGACSGTVYRTGPLLQG